ncbi:hypothetical protein PSTG_07675 [Puccinia striiformis f. sp. tritici PST-78]|uniref:GPI mannosyltransferase 2 n=1 Tax=Puccinia striiformis f. sp. tritici PST-78 TaxID=1165861 RepID=A0A0L0VIE0_9BASI|nr:hypothetical protein PSTG_07675 [Puccinia striiformis f. sp. tritici PST-78]
MNSQFIKIISLSVGIRALTLTALLLLPVPPFDHSAQLKHQTNTQLIRWDTLHFLKIASATSKAEQDWAFGNGIIHLIKLTNHSIILSSVLASLASIISTCFLYLLTLKISNNSIGYSSLVATLHIFSPSPSTQVVPYTEPFYACFSFLSILVLSSSNKNFKIKVGAALCAGLATSFRSIGVIQSIQFLPDWLTYLKTYKRTKSYWIGLLRLTGQTLVLGSITCFPFIYDQIHAYLLFCVDPTAQRPWCSNRIPSIYAFVQSHYWNNGFLKYWTWNQLPLFILSFPIYLISFQGIISYYYYSSSTKTTTRRTTYLDNPEIRIHVLIQLFITLILLFNSHVQIILRQASTMPIIWWTLADQIQHTWDSQQQSSSDKDKNRNKITCSHWWFTYIVIWFPISLLLWAGFYPPA